MISKKFIFWLLHFTVVTDFFFYFILFVLAIISVRFNSFFCGIFESRISLIVFFYCFFVFPFHFWFLFRERSKSSIFNCFYVEIMNHAVLYISLRDIFGNCLLCNFFFICLYIISLFMLWVFLPRNFNHSFIHYLSFLEWFKITQKFTVCICHNYYDIWSSTVFWLIFSWRANYFRDFEGNQLKRSSLNPKSYWPSFTWHTTLHEVCCFFFEDCHRDSREL